jgi:lysosome membrane protein 2
MFCVYLVRLGAPVVLTLPHFLGAANEYTSLVDGLTPDADKHRIFLDVEPVSYAHSFN